MGGGGHGRTDIRHVNIVPNSTPQLGSVGVSLSNTVTFAIEQYSKTCKWNFLVIKNLCAPGVFGTDFLNTNNVGVQLTNFGQNHLTFLDRPEVRVPLHW